MADISTAKGVLSADWIANWRTQNDGTISSGDDDIELRTESGRDYVRVNLKSNILSCLLTPTPAVGDFGQFYPEVSFEYLLRMDDFPWSTIPNSGAHFNGGNVWGGEHWPGERAWMQGGQIGGPFENNGGVNKGAQNRLDKAMPGGQFKLIGLWAGRNHPGSPDTLFSWNSPTNPPHYYPDGWVRVRETHIFGPVDAQQDRYQWGATATAMSNLGGSYWGRRAGDTPSFRIIFDKDDIHWNRATGNPGFRAFLFGGFFSNPPDDIWVDIADFHAFSDAQTVGGTGAGVLCSAVPNMLNFGQVQIGDSSNKVFSISHVGDSGTLSGTVTEACEHYSIVGTATYSLAIGESQNFTIKFQPTAQGTHVCSVETGNGLCVDVSCTGGGTVEPPPSGTLPPEEGCASYTIQSGAGAIAVPPGGFHDVVLRFEPQIEGDLNCTLMLGELCSDITMQGEGLPSSDDPLCDLECAGQITCNLEGASKSMDWNQVNVGSIKIGRLVINNVGGGTLTGSYIIGTEGTGSFGLINSEGFDSSSGGIDLRDAFPDWKDEPLDSFNTSPNDKIRQSTGAGGRAFAYPNWALPTAGKVGVQVDTDFFETNQEAGVFIGQVSESPTRVVFNGYMLLAEVVGQNIERITLHRVVWPVTSDTPSYSLLKTTPVGAIPRSSGIRIRLEAEPNSSQEPVLQMMWTADLTGTPVLASTHTDTGQAWSAPTHVGVVHPYIEIRGGHWDNFNLYGGGTSQSGPFTIQGSNVVNVPAGASQEIAIAFQPTEERTYQAVLTGTGTHECGNINLFGEGVGGGGTGGDDPICLVAPTNLNYGTVATGTQTDRQFTVQNIGGGVLNGTVFLPSTTYYEIVNSPNPASFSLSPEDQPEPFSVRFTPLSQGTWTGEVEVESESQETSELAYNSGRMHDESQWHTNVNVAPPDNFDVEPVQFTSEMTTVPNRLPLQAWGCCMYKGRIVVGGFAENGTDKGPIAIYVEGQDQNGVRFFRVAELGGDDCNSSGTGPDCGESSPGMSPSPDGSKIIMATESRPHGDLWTAEWSANTLPVQSNFRRHSILPNLYFGIGLHINKDRNEGLYLVSGDVDHNPGENAEGGMWSLFPPNWGLNPLADIRFTGDLRAAYFSVEKFGSRYYAAGGRNTFHNEWKTAGAQILIRWNIIGGSPTSSPSEVSLPSEIGAAIGALKAFDANKMFAFNRVSGSLGGSIDATIWETTDGTTWTRSWNNTVPYGGSPQLDRTWAQPLIYRGVLYTGWANGVQFGILTYDNVNGWREIYRSVEGGFSSGRSFTQRDGYIYLWGVSRSNPISTLFRITPSNRPGSSSPCENVNLTGTAIVQDPGETGELDVCPAGRAPDNVNSQAVPLSFWMRQNTATDVHDDTYARIVNHGLFGQESSTVGLLHNRYILPVHAVWYFGDDNRQTGTVSFDLQVQVDLPPIDPDGVERGDLVLWEWYRLGGHPDVIPDLNNLTFLRLESFPVAQTTSAAGQPYYCGNQPSRHANYTAWIMGAMHAQPGQPIFSAFYTSLRYNVNPDPVNCNRQVTTIDDSIPLEFPSLAGNTWTSMSISWAFSDTDSDGFWNRVDVTMTTPGIPAQTRAYGMSRGVCGFRYLTLSGPSEYAWVKEVAGGPWKLGATFVETWPEMVTFTNPPRKLRNVRLYLPD